MKKQQMGYVPEDAELVLEVTIQETEEMLTAVEDAYKQLGWDKIPAEVIVQTFAARYETELKREVYAKIKKCIPNFSQIFKGDTNHKRFHQTIRKVGFRMMIKQGSELAIKDLVENVKQMMVQQGTTKEELDEVRAILADLQETVQEKFESLAKKQEQGDQVLMHRIFELSNSIHSTYFALNKQQEQINSEIWSDLSQQQTQLDAQKKLLDHVVSIQNNKGDDFASFRAEMRKFTLEVAKQFDQASKENRELKLELESARESNYNLWKMSAYMAYCAGNFDLFYAAKINMLLGRKDWERFDQTKPPRGDKK